LRLVNTVNTELILSG